MGIKNYSTLSFYSLALFFVLLLGCSKSFNPDVQRGSNYNFKEGYPEVRFSGIGLINQQGEPTINITADIVYGSLIFDQNEDKYISKLAADIHIVKKSDSDSVISSKRYTFDVKKEDPNITHSQETFSFQKDISVDPGNYKVVFTLTDLKSDKKITNSDHIYIPDPNANTVNLTNIKMLGKDAENDSSNWSPTTTYDVQASTDSLKFIFQVTNNKSDKPLVINSSLVRYKSDTTAARPMHFNNYSPSSIAYKGIDYDQSTTLKSNKRKLLQAGNVLIEFTFANPRKGNYRFRVSTNKTNEEGDDKFKGRDFGVKSEHYPSVKSPRELARPLIYLMDEDEYDNLLKIKNPDSLKAAIDRFWLKNVGNKSETKSVIQKYYQRVVQANKQFSNFKAGWKTDTGMMYILFGPPWYVNESLDEMKWSYSYNREDPERNFFFHQPKMENKYFPFKHYLLQRSQGYFTLQYQQVQLWLNGLILKRDI